MLNQAQYLLGALVTVAAAAALPLVNWGDSEGTVVAKDDRGVYDYGCQAGSTVAGPVAVPVWGSCSVPTCWRLLVRDTDGNTWRPCVSREEYNRTPLGSFWHGRTDE
jgi:hypothetical protein